MNDYLEIRKIRKMDTFGGSIMEKIIIMKRRIIVAIILMICITIGSVVWVKVRAGHKEDFIKERQDLINRLKNYEQITQNIKVRIAQLDALIQYIGELEVKKKDKKKKKKIKKQKIKEESYNIEPSDRTPADQRPGNIGDEKEKKK